MENRNGGSAVRTAWLASQSVLQRRSSTENTRPGREDICVMRRRQRSFKNRKMEKHFIDVYFWKEFLG